MDESALLRYFQTEAAARAAAKELKQNNFTEVQVSVVSPYPGANASDLDNPISEPIASLGTEILETDVAGPDEGVLLAASPDASGMAGGEPHHSMENWLVTVVTETKRREEADHVLKKHGALR
ncbi:hypothetical protein [Numidum massiliense]|uniref:hypothetical protein n=1 Tax=Numidum massiliense TaxID=1522315 RepID=UPI0006D59831|nr:hypothetical protein [Numidum massiliense]